jgi:hypothetical protein
MQQALSVKKTKEMLMQLVQNAPLDTGKILLHRIAKLYLVLALCHSHSLDLH